MTQDKVAKRAFTEWYDGLDKKSGDLPPKGAIAIGLVILDRLKKEYDLNLSSHLAKGKAQIQSAGKAAVTRILAEFGESRPFLGEGRRTNRAAGLYAQTLFDCLQPLALDRLDPNDRDAILTAIQAMMVDKALEFHKQECIKPVYDPAQSSRAFIGAILELADIAGKRGPVAQYLVGAKLKLRFPDITIRNELSSAADNQSGQPGDFVVGDTSFHVTVAPNTGHYEKCAKNLSQGRRVFLLVPEQMVVGTRQNAEQIAKDQIAVESIESFVGQNVEELSTFSKLKLVAGLRELLEIYNERVDDVENDKSLLIEIPHNLTS